MFFFLVGYFYWMSVLFCFVFFVFFLFFFVFSKIGRVLIEWRKGGYLSEFGKLGGGC